ncbi:MAG: sensor histidine kinase [bacterium]|nr:MAG: sensor histidine kinase [bacterium]
MVRTLYGKMAAVLFFLFLVLGLLNILWTLLTTRMYIQEASQNLNRHLAGYLVGKNFFLQDGRVNREALEESFETLMGINPGIELYLLDTEGMILTYSAPPGRIRKDRISLDPVLSFIRGDGKTPILGEDPRGIRRRKAFSAAPVPGEGEPEGYLYVILGGEEYDSVSELLRGSYILRLSLWVTLSGLLFFLAAGLFLFAKLTRRHRSLARAMEAFREGDFGHPVPLPEGFRDPPGDEIDRLGSVFSQMSERINEQIAGIRRVDGLRRELVSNISHDLRMPLAAIQGYLESVQLKDDRLSPEERGAYVASAIRHARRLGKLIDDLFELAKLDSPDVRIDPVAFPLGELVQDVIQDLSLPAREKGIRLAAELPEDLPDVRADLKLMDRVLHNLVENAVRYTRGGGEVSVSLAREGSSVSVRISDTGPGISADDLPHIFERFYRIRRAEGQVAGGSGLGLAIAQRIVQLHGGTIDVASEPGRGTTFAFQIPEAAGRG